MEWATILLRGYSVLLVAILANFLANKLKLITWFSYVGKWEADAWSLLFLFVIYPLLLGLAYQIPEVIGLVK